MIKKLLLLSAVAMLSCSEKNSYTVNGTVESESFNGLTVCLKKIVDKQLTTVDSTVIEDNTFTFKGTIETPAIYFITVANALRAEFILESAKIDVTIGNGLYSVSGTEMNVAISDYMKQRADIMQKNDESIDTELQNLGYEFLKKNINNKAGECMSIRITNRMEPEKIDELLALANPETLQLERFKDIVIRTAAAKKVAVGQHFVDLVMPSPHGDTVKLSDYAGKGKYVLVDFWASWCNPCRQAMPELVEIYEKYKGKDFEIVGVSFDQDKESWIAGIEELNMTWVQMSDVKFWQSEGAKLYNVRGIPHTVLIDPQGIIIEKDLGGAELQAKLEELIK